MNDVLNSTINPGKHYATTYFLYVSVGLDLIVGIYLLKLRVEVTTFEPGNLKNKVRIPSDTMWCNTLQFPVLQGS